MNIESLKEYLNDTKKQICRLEELESYLKSEIERREIIESQSE